LARIVGEKCLFPFCTEATVYSEITQSRKMQKIITHTNMALAARRQIIGGGGPIIKNSRRRRPQIGGGARGRCRVLT